MHVSCNGQYKVLQLSKQTYETVTGETKGRPWFLLTLSIPCQHQQVITILSEIVRGHCLTKYSHSPLNNNMIMMMMMLMMMTHNDGSIGRSQDSI